MTRTKGTPEESTEAAAIVGEEMHGWLREVEGFEGLLVLTNLEAGATHVIALWESREVAERHRVARANLRDRVTTAANVEVLETESYDVAFAAFPETSG